MQRSFGKLCSLSNLDECEGSEEAGKEWLTKL